MIDGILALAVLAGLVLNAVAGWWWADPAAGSVLVYNYAAREVPEIFTRKDDAAPAAPGTPCSGCWPSSCRIFLSRSSL